MFWRGCRKKCPQCGQGALFRRWITLHDHCSVCGLKYLENQGDLWGYLLLIDRGLFILPLIVMIYFASTIRTRFGFSSSGLRWFSR